MGDMLKKGLEWLAQKRTATMASTITYRRTSYLTAELQATIGKPDMETVDEGNVRIGAAMIDFLILGSDFIPTFGEPKCGDKVVSDGRTYEVMDFAGQGHWRWSGRPGSTLRIHTKQIS